MQPSARNPRAIHAYEKVGFKRLELSIEATTLGTEQLLGQRVHGHAVSEVGAIERR